MQEDMSAPWRTARWPSRTIAVAFGACIWLVTSRAYADPQMTVGLTVGAAGRAIEHRFWDKTVFHLGVRGDVLFARSNVSSFGVGPYAEVATHAFDELQFGGGVATLLPVMETFPLVVSAGGYGRYSPAYGTEPGIAGSIFWGTRSYNHHGPYNMSAGLLAQFRYGLGVSGETSLVVSAQVDLVALSLPFHFLVNAIRGGSSATRPVPHPPAPSPHSGEGEK